MLGERPRDRKSTRLNSIHLRISYAVFCLKKKEKKSLALATDHGTFATIGALRGRRCAPVCTGLSLFAAPPSPLGARVLPFFFLIIGGPPRFPPFPSPTLFR